MTTEERLEKVEKELMRGRKLNRWLLTGIGIVFVACIVVWAFGPKTATAQPAGTAVSEVFARKFVVVDENGKTRAMLYMGRDGPSLTLFDEKGKSRVILEVYQSDVNLIGVDKNVPRLCLRDEKGNYRAGIWVDKDVPRLGLYDENNKTRALMSVLKEGPSLGLYDEDSNTLWKAP